MKKVRLCFLWHMHQPYYKNDPDGKYHLPWVFLHAIKDYYELPAYHREFNSLKATYNIVPSLAVQLKDYANGTAEDTTLELIKKDPATLSTEERNALLSQLFMANVPNMIKPLKRYFELYNRGKQANIFDHSAAAFSDEEITELSTLFLLAWCGEFTRKEVPAAKRLIKKGFGFSREDLFELLDALQNFVGKIIPLYKELAAQNKIEVSATPFYHPILPLLIDINSAKEAYKDIPMPSVTEVDLSEDARFHVNEAVKSHETDFGVKPTGMWPAEGSVSTKAAELFAENGIRWIASDEDVLGNSIGKDMSNPKNRHLLYSRNYIDTKNGRVFLFFRDKTISDLIGFTYSGWNAEEAATDFINRIKKISDSYDRPLLIPVILDGENAWEYYPENASTFFKSLYEKLEQEDDIETCTMAEAIEKDDIPENALSKITAGSWIYGNFTTWLGHSEKNEGWKHLTAAAAVLEKNKDNEGFAEAQKELRIAEGSDWFWWYGDDHFSLQSDIFDKLFRTHLSNMYSALGIEPPAELSKPIKKTYRTGLVKSPSCYISPVLDGTVSSFYEWLGSGIFDLKFDSGAMHASGTLLDRLLFGYDKNMLYLRLEGGIASSVDRGYEVIIEITCDGKKTFTVPLNNTEGEARASENENGEAVLFGIGDIFEAGIPLSNIFKASKDKIYVSFKVKKDGDVVEKSPLYNLVEIDVSSSYDDDWMV